MPRGNGEKGRQRGKAAALFNLPLALALSPASLAVAQEEEVISTPNEPREPLDLSIDYEPVTPDFEECAENQEAAELTGEIIVCRKRGEENHRLYNKDRAERIHAARTAFKEDPKTPDLIADCHDQGQPLGCVGIGGVPPPVYYIDFDALPDAPAGSDADRIARGLAPRGHSAVTETGAVVIAGDRAAMAEKSPELRESLSPSGSASPAEGPSG